MRRICGVFVAVLLCALSARAQTIVNPTAVEFVPSADHTVVLPTGQPMVDRYDLAFYQTGVAAPFSTVPLGKPAPAAGICSASLPLTGLPLSSTQTWVVRVIAVGPTGVGASTPSNPFLAVGAPVAPASVVLK